MARTRDKIRPRVSVVRPALLLRKEHVHRGVPSPPRQQLVQEHGGRRDPDVVAIRATEAALAVPPPLVPVLGRVVAEREGRSAGSANYVLFVRDAVDQLVVVHGLPSEELAKGLSLRWDRAEGGDQPVPPRVFTRRGYPTHPLSSRGGSRWDHIAGGSAALRTSSSSRKGSFFTMRGGGAANRFF